MSINDRWAGMPEIRVQSEILGEISQDLRGSITGSWVDATFTVLLYGGQETAQLKIVDEDNNIRFGRFQTASDLARSLKHVMFVEGHGSWFTMVLTIHNDGAVNADFDYETQPELDSPVMGVNPYWTAREQQDFPRDRAHQPDWYAELLDEFVAAAETRLDIVAARDRGWAGVGQAGPESYDTRLVVLPTGVGIVATGGYSDPSLLHPGDPGFELFMPSPLFTGDVEKARQVWPFKGLNHLVMITSDEDIDWPVRTVEGPWVVTYFPNVANTAPWEWRGEVDGQDVCGLLVGVPYPGVPATLDGPMGPIRLVGVIPARPAEWAFLASGGDTARRDVADRLSQLTPEVLASPDRPSVV